MYCSATPKRWLLQTKVLALVNQSIKGPKPMTCGMEILWRWPTFAFVLFFHAKLPMFHHLAIQFCDFQPLRCSYVQRNCLRKTLVHLGMVLETACRFSGSQIPKAQCFVPWTGQCVVTVWWQNYVTDEVRVTVQTLLWNTIVGFVTSQFPYNQCLVCERSKGYKECG